MPPLLTMSGITKRFPGVVANRDVTIEVQRGEILGLLGENGAGKTTLMNILYGLLAPDEGEILIEGKPVVIHSPRDALAHGIGMVHQHFMLVPDMTVTENIALGQRSESSRLPLSRLREVAERITALSTRYGMKVDPRARIEQLSVGMQQRVEILKVLSRGAEVLVLDEPTSSLTPPEWDDLAAVLRAFVAEGKSVIFITHKLDELLSVADRCTVLRDGAVVGTVQVSESDKPTLARLMVGREVVLRLERPILSAGSPLLEVENLSLTDERGTEILQDITFEVREYEVLGVAGVDGNGQRELVEVLIGLRPWTTGRVGIWGSVAEHQLTPTRFAQLGGAVIPDDRHRTALALDLEVTDNILMREFGRAPFSKMGVLNGTAMRHRAHELIDEYDVRTPSLHVRMRQLSGGNQQKVVLARELSREPMLLIAAQPTRGLDVGATEYVYRKMVQHKRNGGATLLISTELDEILSLSDRIAVMYRGRFLRILDAHDADPELLGLLMAGEATQA